MAIVGHYCRMLNGFVRLVIPLAILDTRPRSCQGARRMLWCFLYSVGVLVKRLSTDGAALWRHMTIGREDGAGQILQCRRSTNSCLLRASLSQPQGTKIGN